MNQLNAYRDDKVHVCQDLCATCVFRPGNFMHLEPGRLADLVAQARANESAIIGESICFVD